MTRKETREKVAETVNALTREQLLNEFGISRVADISALDTIGLPVYSCARPLSRTIATNAGKGLTREAARAGAILESIEVEVAEHPSGPCRITSASKLPSEERLGLEDCFPARSSIVNDYTPLAWEEMVNVQNGEAKLVPSDLVWMTTRITEQAVMYFQMSSNGLACGGSIEDAILSGLYEVLERDGWSLQQFLMDNCGIMPIRVPLVNLTERMEALVRKIEAAKVKLYLFDATTDDYKVPVFGASLLDLSGQCAGTFSGYGCHLSAEIAAIRAITEACQSRACYISGARDDMFRRQFLLMKRLDHVRMDEIFGELELGNPISDYRQIGFDDIRSELRYLLKLLRQYGVSEVYVKELGSVLDGAVQVVRVLSPQCESCRFDHWTPGLRAISYAERKMAELTKEEIQ